MTRAGIIEEAESVAWIELSKGGYRAAKIIEAMLAELRRQWAELDRVKGRYIIGDKLNNGLVREDRP